ncbi:MAG: hypothetical protein ABI591_16630 [Kofleriaceae bacterium]
MSRVSLRGLAIGPALYVWAGLATLAVRSEAQPAPPDFARAKQLYDAASSELDKGAYTDAVRDFGAAYEITKDPVVFYKIGVANEKAGKCDVALVYYARYVREAKPAQHFIDVTKERVAACGGDWRSLEAKPVDKPADKTDSLAGMETGSASMPVKVPSSKTGLETLSATGPTTNPTNPTGNDAGSANSGSGSGSGSADTTADAGIGSAAPITAHRHGRDAPWLMVGGALAFVTAGAVLAYSASSSEQDIRDLYVGLNNQSPVFDPSTQQRYQELLDEGHRYQYLAWGSFAIATGFAAAATILFVRDHDEEDQQRVFVTPTASPTGAGVSATIRF